MQTAQFVVDSHLASRSSRAARPAVAIAAIATIVLFACGGAALAAPAPPVMTPYPPFAEHVDFSASPNPAEANELIHFHGDAYLDCTTAFFGGCKPDSYHWSFGDGTVASGQDVLHEYPTPNTYSVSLSASCSYCTTASRAYEVTVGARGTQPTAAPEQTADDAITSPNPPAGVEGCTDTDATASPLAVSRFAVASRYTGGGAVLTTSRGFVGFRPLDPQSPANVPTARGFAVPGLRPGRNTWALTVPVGMRVRRSSGSSLRVVDVDGRVVATILATGVGDDPDAPIIGTGQDGRLINVESSVPSSLVVDGATGATTPVVPECIPTAPSSSVSARGNSSVTAVTPPWVKKCQLYNYLPFQTQLDRPNPLTNGRGTISCPEDAEPLFVSVSSQLESSPPDSPGRYDIRAVDFDAALGTAAAVATAHARCRPSPGIVWSWGNRPSGLLVSRLKPYIVAKKGHLRLATFTGCA